MLTASNPTSIRANARAFSSVPTPILAKNARRRLVVSRSKSDESLALSDLRSQLEDALKLEDYKAAARLRDEIQQMSMHAKLAVEDANQKFYDAFRSGSIKAMEEVWGQGDHVQCIHPGSDCIAGREAVIESWRSILAGVRPRAFKIDVEDVRVWASGDTGYVTCVEVVDADDSMGRVAATNIFERQDGQWVMVLHQGGPAPMRRRPRIAL